MQTEESDLSSDRRTGPDFRLRMISLSGLVGWLVLLAAMIVFSEARPEPETVVSRFHNTFVRTAWNSKLTGGLVVLMTAALTLSITGLLMSATRTRRKYDQIRVNLIAMGLISLLGISLFLFFI